MYAWKWNHFIQNMLGVGLKYLKSFWPGDTCFFYICGIAPTAISEPPPNLLIKGWMTSDTLQANKPIPICRLCPQHLYVHPT